MAKEERTIRISCIEKLTRGNTRRKNNQEVPISERTFKNITPEELINLLLSDQRSISSKKAEKRGIIWQLRNLI